MSRRHCSTCTCSDRKSDPYEETAKALERFADAWRSPPTYARFIGAQILDRI